MSNLPLSFILQPDDSTKRPFSWSPNACFDQRTLNIGKFDMHKTGLIEKVLAIVVGIASSLPAAEKWEKIIVQEGQHCTTAVACDVNDDGLADVITSSNNKTRLYVAPDWTEIVLYEGVGCIHSELIDADGDGDLDWVGARYNPGLIIWLECPDKPLEQKWTMRLVDDQVHGIHGLLTGDVDRKGKPDLLATSAQPLPPFPDSLVWYSIPDDVKQAERWERHVFADRDAPGLTHYLGVGDINGDGRPDAATGAKGGPQDESGKGEYFAWWEAPRDPTTPWKKHLVSVGQPGATNIHPADINGDGKTDLLASRGHGKGVVWFENPSWKEHTIQATIQEPHCLVVLDLDDDGDVDAATCGYGSKEVMWFENDGKGKFVSHLIGTDQEAYDIRAVDLESDGDLDLLIAGRGSKNVVWYRNPRISESKTSNRSQKEN